MIDLIVNWYKLYPSPVVFIGHKLTHIAVGALIGYVAMHFSLIAAIVLVFAAAIGKEYSDRSQSYDESAPKGEEYRYDAPMSAHVIDVIITVLGGFGGIALGFTTVFPPIIMGILLVISLGAILMSQHGKNGD